MKIFKKILHHKKSGIALICGAFFLFAVSWFAAPKFFARIARYQKELSRAVVPVSLPLEEKKKIEREILETENSIRSSNKKGENNYASQYVSLGEKLEQLGYRAKAVKAYQSAVREDGKNISAYMHLGAVLRLMGDQFAARNAFRTAIDLNPSDATLYPKLAYVYADGLKDSATARGIFLEGLIRTNNDTRLIQEYIPFLEKIGEYSEAKLYQQELSKRGQKNIIPDTGKKDK